MKSIFVAQLLLVRKDQNGHVVEIKAPQTLQITEAAEEDFCAAFEAEQREVFPDFELISKSCLTFPVEKLRLALSDTVGSA